MAGELISQVKKQRITSYVHFRSFSPLCLTTCTKEQHILSNDEDCQMDYTRKLCTNKSCRKRGIIKIIKSCRKKRNYQKRGISVQTKPDQIEIEATAWPSSVTNRKRARFIEISQQSYPETSYNLFACWFQPGLISHDTVFFSHNKSAPAGLISSETNQRTD